MDATTFALPLWADLTAVAVGSVQGAVFASGFRERRIDLLGVAIIGVGTGLGGGVLRDVALSAPLAALSNNWYLLTAIAAALIGMLLARMFHRVDGLITALDAVTLGLFGAIGTTKALSYGLPTIPAIFVGVIAAVGGGILRDILLNIPIAVMHVSSLYAVAAGIGTIVLVITERLFDANAYLSASLCAAATIVVRLLAVKFGWSLPEQRVLSLPRPRAGFALLRRGSAKQREYSSTETGTIYKIVPRDGDR